MAKIDLDDLKRQIMVLSASSLAQKTHSDKLQALALQKREAAEQILIPALTPMGANWAQVREKAVQSARDFRDQAKGLWVPQAETIATNKTAFQKSVDSRRVALEKTDHLVPGPIHIEYLPRPIYIGESIPPVDPLPKFLRDSSIEPYDSRAKIYIATDVGFSTDGYSTYYGPTFDFWYVWSSSSSLESFVKITAPLVYNGSVYLELMPAEIYKLWNRLDFGIFSTLTVYQHGTGAPLIPSPVVPSMYLATSPFTDDARFIPLEYLTSSVQNPYVIVPPNGTILVRVSAIFHWEFRNGWGPDNGEPGNNVRCDFANDRLDYFLQSPFVAVEVAGPIVAQPTSSG